MNHYLLKMARKKAKKAKPIPPKPAKDVHEAPRPEHEDGKPDYGGLPRIDLKKNLGCG